MKNIKQNKVIGSPYSTTHDFGENQTFFLDEINVIKKNNKNNTRIVSFRISIDQFNKLKNLADKYETSMNAIISYVINKI
jgi:uncharacterized protein (DUF4415 family)